MAAERARATARLGALLALILLAAAGSAAFLRLRPKALPSSSSLPDPLDSLALQLKEGARRRGLHGRVLWAAKLEGSPDPASGAELEALRRSLGERLAGLDGWTLLREEDLLEVRPRVKAMARASKDPDQARQLLEKAYLPSWDYVGLCAVDRGGRQEALRCRLLDASSATVLEARAPLYKKVPS